MTSSRPDQKIVQAFRLDQEPLLRERMNIILLMGFFLMPTFAVLDYILYPQYFVPFLIYRVVDSLACLALFAINKRWDFGYRSLYLGTTAYYIVGLSIIKMVVDAGGYATPYYAGLILVFLGFSTVLTVGVRLFAIHCLILYAVYIASVIAFNQPQSIGIFVANNMFLAGTLVIALIAAWVNESLRLSEYLTRTELKEAQAKLEQYSKILEKNIAASEAKYRHVVENANEAIVIYQDERPQFFNARALAIFGCTEKEFGSLSFFSAVHQDDRYLVSQRYYRRLRGEKGPQLNEFRVYDKSGDVKWLQASMVVVDWEGRSAILAIMNDVTESIKARLEINKLQDQLTQSQKMEAIGTLAGGVAHDFNNILQAISGYVQLLLVKRDESDADFGALSEIDASVERAGQLIKQLLTFSRRIERELEPVDLNQEVLHACQFLERTIPKMIRIENRLAGDLKQVSADKTQINQILMNLGSNASHAMPEGGRLVIETGNVHLDEFYTRANPDMEPGEYVFLRVSDNGHGIDEATIKHIFEPFFTTKGLGQGTGLGLATVYGIVTAHGGHVTCQSEVEQGSSFSIYLPAIETQPDQRAEEAGLESEHLGGAETILLVDDEQAILDAAEEMLRHYGYKTITAASGEEALDKYRIKADLIDVVILDLGMPGMGGQSCLKKILEFDPAARVIIASGYSADGQIEEVMQSGAMEFIGKPYRLAELLRKIRGVMGNAGLTAARH